MYRKIRAFYKAFLLWWKYLPEGTPFSTCLMITSLYVAPNPDELKQQIDTDKRTEAELLDKWTDDIILSSNSEYARHVSAGVSDQSIGTLISVVKTTHIPVLVLYDVLSARASSSGSLAVLSFYSDLSKNELKIFADGSRVTASRIALGSAAYFSRLSVYELDSHIDWLLGSSSYF